MPRVITLLVTLHASFAAAQTGPTQRELDAAYHSTDWLYATHDYSGQRFVNLKQITPANARSLRPVCAYQASDLGSFQVNPLVYRGIMYVTTRRATVAIDAATCREKWRHSLGPVASGEPKSVTDFLRNVFPNRGAALKDGNVVRGAPDGRLVALDAATGALRWARVVADSTVGEMFTMPPLIVDDLIVIGPAASEAGVRGWVGAFRLSDGEPIWKTYMVPDSGAPGSETWRLPAAIKHGGGATWTPYSLDRDAGLLFAAAGNPAPDLAGDLRPGDNLYTNSLVALDARSGALRWYRQMVPHDVHDWDLTQAGPLFTVHVRGAPRRLIATAGKDGFLRVLDRESHDVLYEVAVTTRENVEAPLGREWVRVCPGYLGGVEWNGPAFSPVTGMLYVPAVDWCGSIRLSDTVKIGPDEGFFGGEAQLDSLTQGSGWLTAVEATTGKVRWRYRAPAPMVAGVTTTPSGVLFTGDVDGEFLTMNARTGDVLYRFHTGGPVAGGVITYAVNGKQYVADASGSLPIFRRPNGAATVFVFALP